MKQIHRSLIATGLMVAAAALLVALALHDRAQRDAEQQQAEQRRRPLDLDPDAVEGLVLERDGQRIELHREDDGWQLTAPIQDLADQYTVLQVLQGAAFLELSSVLDGSGAAPELAALGLAPPRLSWTFAQGGATQGLQLGGRNSFNDRHYLRAGAAPEQASVGMIDSKVARVFDRDLHALRDKRLLRCRTAEISAVQVESPGLRDAIDFALHREDRGAGAVWTLDAPKVGPADAATVDLILTEICAALFTRVYEEQPAALARYGLDPPVLRLTVTRAGQPATLELGAPAEDDPSKRYALRGGLSAVVNVAVHLQRALQQDVFALEEKRALPLEAARVEQLKLQLDSGDFAVLQREHPDGSAAGWSLLAPRPGPVNDAQVDALLTALTTARAQRYARSDLPADPPAAVLAPLGLAPALRSVQAYDAGGALLATIRLGSLDGELRHVLREGDSRVLLIPQAELQQLPHVLEDLLPQTE